MGEVWGSSGVFCGGFNSILIMSEFKLTADEQLEEALIYIDKLQESITELIPIAEQFSDNYPVSSTVLRVKQVIKKAKKLIP